MTKLTKFEQLSLMISSVEGLPKALLVLELNKRQMKLYPEFRMLMQGLGHWCCPSSKLRLVVVKGFYNVG